MENSKTKKANIYKSLCGKFHESNHITDNLQGKHRNKKWTFQKVLAVIFAI